MIAKSLVKVHKKGSAGAALGIEGKVKNILFTTVLFCLMAGTAQAYDACARYGAGTVQYNACQLTDLYDISMDDALTAYVLSTNAYTARICGFKMTDRFNKALANLFRNKKCRDAYEFSLNMFINLPQVIPNTTEFCRQNAIHLGVPNGMIRP